MEKKIQSDTVGASNGQGYREEKTIDNNRVMQSLKGRKNGHSGVELLVGMCKRGRW